MLRKVVYPYEFMDDWKKFNKASLTGKEDFYSHLKMEDVTDADYTHAKKVCKDIWIKNVGEYHDLYVQSDTLLLADVFENFRNMCSKIYKFEHGKKALKITKLKVDLSIDIDMLLMVEKDTKGGICLSIYWYATSINKYMKDYDKNKESSYLQYWDVNSLYG